MLIDYKKELDLMADYVLSVLSHKINKPLIKPTRVNFDITNRCPLKCIMCNICRRNHKVEEELTLKELKNIIDQIHDWGIKYVSFAGGESLVRKDDVVKLIKYASSKDLFTALITNGFIHDKKLFKNLIKAGLGKLTISIDGSNKKTHDFIRGKGSFERAIKTAKYFVKLRGKKDRPELEFATCVMSYNFRELVKIYDLMKSIGFDYMNYQAVVPDNDYKKMQPSVYNVDYWLNKKQTKELEKIVDILIKIKKNEGRIRNTKQYLRLMPEYFRLKGKFNPGRCMAGFKIINIDPYGNINICGLGPNLNVKDAPLKDLWKHKKYKETRIRIKHCKVPCLMLCYEKLSFSTLYSAWIDKQIGMRMRNEQ